MVNHLEGSSNEPQEGHDKSRNTGEGLVFRGLSIRLLEASGRNSVTTKRVEEPHGPVVVCTRQSFELWRDVRAQDRENGNSKRSHQSTDRGKDQGTPSVDEGTLICRRHVNVKARRILACTKCRIGNIQPTISFDDGER